MVEMKGKGKYRNIGKGEKDNHEHEDELIRELDEGWPIHFNG